LTEEELHALAPWFERRHERWQRIDATPAQALAATLDLPDTGQWTAGVPLPPMWQQLYMLDMTPSAGLGDDGSPQQDGGADGLMPPVPLPQVMWAGAEFIWHAPLRVGGELHRRSRLAEMSLKQGRRGPMVFVAWEHLWSQDGALALTELNRGVFLGPESAPASAAPTTEVPKPMRERYWPMDAARLFRFSALTFNSHRIHYDLAYARDVAGYPSLVVHGPLQALLISETSRHWWPERMLRQASYRARAPMFLDHVGPRGLRVCGNSAAFDAGADTVQLWTCGDNGLPCMQATLQFAPRA